LARKKDDINSTEKLLNVIRGKSQEKPGIEKLTAAKPGKKTAKILDISSAKHAADKKRYTVGVDYGQGFIALAKTIKAADGRPMLLDHKVIKYDHLTTKNTPEFNNILKSALVSFCGSFANCSIWTMMPAGEVNVHYLKIPQVPKKQLENVVYWTAKKETSFDEKESLFDFEIQAEITDQGLPKYLAMAYTAPKAEVEKIKRLFSGIGVPLAGITIAPFAIQNIFRSGWLTQEEENYASLFIGNDFSRIDIYSRQNLVMTRGIKTGTSSMVEAIVDSFAERKGNIRLDFLEAKKILMSLGPDGEKLSRTDPGFTLREDEILEMIFPVWERLARQVERTLQYYASSVGYQKVEKIFIASSMIAYNPILIYMNDQLGVKTEFFDPFAGHASYSGAQSLTLSERTWIVPILGLSLSDNKRTPNAIFTYLEKNKEIRVARINRGIFAAFAAALAVCVGAIIYQAVEMSSFAAKRGQLQNQLSAYNPVLSTEQISQMADDVKKYRRGTRQYAQRYLAAAAIGEISSVTPANIKLINFKIAPPASNPAPDKAAQEKNRDIAIEGVIFGERDMLESLLAQYVMKLENSPIFGEVKIKKSSINNFRKSEILHFTLEGKVG